MGAKEARAKVDFVCCSASTVVDSENSTTATETGKEMKKMNKKKQQKKHTCKLS